MWRKINRAVFWAGPAVPTLYSTLFSLASGAAGESQKAKDFLNWLVDLAVLVAATHIIWAAMAMLGLWTAAWVYTAYRADLEEREHASLNALGAKLIETSEGISRLLTLYHAQTAAISQSAEFTSESFQRTNTAHASAGADLLMAYKALYDAQVTSLLFEVEERKIPVSKKLKSKVERPYNQFGIEDMVRGLRILGERITKTR